MARPWLTHWLARGGSGSLTGWLAAALAHSLAGSRRSARRGSCTSACRQVVLDGLRLGLLAVGAPGPRWRSLLDLALDVAGRREMMLVGASLTEW